MESWYKVSLPFEDCGIAGKGQQLQEDFMALLIENAGLPRDAAMFSRRSDDFGKVFYYFSPAAMQIASLLIKSQGATPCSAPLRGTVNLAAGDARALEMLWPPESK
jgi:hypothetical protein